MFPMNIRVICHSYTLRILEEQWQPPAGQIPFTAVAVETAAAEGECPCRTESERFVGYSIGFKGTHGVCVKMGDLPSGYD